ncbi:MAG: SDR family NAD(P)-dependent oxidoreductase [Polymorphobacter sp.]|uniref:SDR family NAD(P)-dependent oxidoreductase n=1 Tax=Polymorphobacter sp. TaxID=1909290 RepID=UPI003A8B942F
MTSQRLQGQTAFVTGAASGIGRATAIRLAEEGAAVMVTDIDVEGGKATVAAITGAGGRAEFAEQDVMDEARWAALVEQTVSLFGRLDILVNNAGIGVGGPVTDMTLETWNKLMGINVTGVFLGTKHALPAMRTPRTDGPFAGRSGGSIINISSVAGLAGAATMSGYCATKGAVRLFTKAVAMECAAARDGVRVNSVHPGIIVTPIWDSIAASDVDLIDGSNALTAEQIGLASPVGYPGTPEDVAAGIAFLASEDSRYMTGSELVIDGGWTAH